MLGRMDRLGLVKRECYLHPLPQERDPRTRGSLPVGHRPLSCVCVLRSVVCLHSWLSVSLCACMSLCLGRRVFVLQG